MKRLLFAAMLVFATVTVTNAQSQFSQQPQPQPLKVYAKEIDSVNVFGLPFNTLAISSISLQGTTLNVRGLIAYNSNGRQSGTPFSFTETWEVKDTDKIDYASIITTLATKKKVNLKQ